MKTTNQDRSAVDRITRVAALSLLAGLGQSVHADSIPYPDAGLYNTATYSFTAASTGDVTAYFVGGLGAGFVNELGLLVNGVVSSAGFGLNNHASLLGDTFNLGPVTAGDSLVFVLRNYSLEKDAYSDSSLNGLYDVAGATDHNHVYSTTHTTDFALLGVPAGIYVAFEDIPIEIGGGGPDFNYDDESFVFTNVIGVATVPEPMGLALLGLGLAGLGLSRRKLTS